MLARGKKISARMILYGEETILRSTLTVVLRARSKMTTDNMGLFTLPCIRAAEHKQRKTLSQVHGRQLLTI
jgi:hypothetical protein